MKNYIQIKIELKDSSLADILIAQLSECGFEGFEEGENYLNAFINEKEFDEEAINKIISDNGLAYTKSIIAEKNWNEEWEKSFDPVLVEDFCAIRASFHQPIKNVNHEIIITPKMSFGTGHHATTYLMIQAISKIDFKEKSVLDFGTGTGVLSILAEKCEAKEILAIDNDDWSVENAKENIAENDCSKIVLQKADSLTETGKPDIILANINKHIILLHFSSFQQHLEKDGVLILSGLLSSDYADIELAANQNHFQIVSKSEKDSWICLSLKIV
ncbi:MAG TPA: 50S ribosomal protein L11 methyltransferase [Puia sp.]|nr:50S ribosomal protein L11 methyltransferase [Puia sp.]